jgi:hypothetical protein
MTIATIILAMAGAALCIGGILKNNAYLEGSGLLMCMVSLTLGISQFT